MRHSILASAVALASVVASAQGDFTPARLASGGLGAAPYGTQSAGIAAFRLVVDAAGAVTDVQPVLEFEPYGGLMREALPAWRFQPARVAGAPVAGPVLVLGLFSPPALAFAAPPAPRYRDTQAPDDVPWPVDVTVQSYPPHATGGGLVIVEVDIAADGSVAATRVASSTPGFEDAATSALTTWKFRPAMRANRDAASRLYVILTFVGDVPPMR